MAEYINNIAAGDGYTPACTIGPDYQARTAVITIANNPALMQFAIGHQGDWHWTDEREFFAIPQSFSVEGVIGVRVRNATPGVVARVLAVLSGPDDVQFVAGNPFTGVLSAGGGVTPGGASVEVDHNGVAISTQPKLDFEDAGAFAWTIVDDPGSSRAKITPPKVLTGRCDQNGNIVQGSGFTVVRNSAGNYTINYNTPYLVAPIPVVSPVNSVAGKVTQQIEGANLGNFGFSSWVGAVATDQGFTFMVFPQ